MRGFDTFVERVVNTSILVGKIQVPARTIADRLSSFSSPATFYSELTDENLPLECKLQLFGSATKVKYRDRYFAILSNHQIEVGEWKFDQLGIINPDTKNFHTSNEAVFPINKTEGDFDLCCFDFTEAVNSKLIPNYDWFDISEDMQRKFIPKPIFVCAIGFPSHLNKIDYDAARFDSVPYAILGDEEKPKISGRLCFRLKIALDFDARGFSGSPVFSIFNEGMQTKAALAGILTNMSSEVANFMPFPSVRKLINHAFDEIGS